MVVVPETAGAEAVNVRGVLLTPRWLLYGLLAIAMAVGMVFLGIWQMHRFELRSSINNRIDSAAVANPVPVTDVLRVGRQPGDDVQFTKVTMTGRYDPAHQMLVRARTVNDNVGYEVLVPLRLSNGAAVLVDRGWLPPGNPNDNTSEPDVPATPTGEVTVVGQVRLPESGAGPVAWRNGHVEVRRINPATLATTLPYKAYGGYVTVTSQRPAASSRFVGIPIDHEDAAMNLSYIVQWWLFSGMALVGFGLLVRWEARKRAGLSAPGGGNGASPTRQLSGDRV